MFILKVSKVFDIYVTLHQHYFSGALLHNYAGDSLHESSVIAGRHEQLGPYEVQDQELAFVQHSTKATRIAFDLV